MKKSEQKRFEAKTREWDEDMRAFRKSNLGRFLSFAQKELKRYFKMFEDLMMYHKRPSSLAERKWHMFVWFLGVALIFFAFKGIGDFISGI